jgi:hypothetical protein
MSSYVVYIGGDTNHQNELTLYCGFYGWRVLSVSEQEIDFANYKMQ